MLYDTFAFMVAAGLGAYLRMQTNTWVGLPWGTLLVNGVGSLLIGFLAIYLGKSAPQFRIVVMVGFLGALTTFSGFSLDLVRLLENGQPGKALLYLLSTNLLCFLACYGGWKLAQKLVTTS
jgi:CrcB protein